MSSELGSFVRRIRTADPSVGLKPSVEITKIKGSEAAQLKLCPFKANNSDAYGPLERVALEVYIAQVKNG